MEANQEDEGDNVVTGAPKTTTLVMKNLLFNNYNQAKKSYRQNKSDNTAKSTERGDISN
jgi:hypothetical protein